jgi:hypothetical protein
MGVAGFHRSIRENIPQESQHVRDSERLLETNGLAAVRSSLTAFHQIAGHVDDRRFLRSRSLEDAAGGVAALHHRAARGKMQVAEKHVRAGAPEMCESFLGGRGAIHAKALGR